MTLTELPLLSELMEDHGISEKTEIRFKRQDDTLGFECEDEGIAEILATFFGCPEGDIHGEEEYEAEPHWHGNGEGNLEELADEISRLNGAGKNFEITISVQRIHRLAGS